MWKRRGVESLLRKVQKMVNPKSLYKRGRSTRKLASKLTIQGPQCPKNTLHRYLRFDLWSLFIQEACFTQNLQKPDGKWLQFAKEWQKWTVWRLENAYIYRWRFSVSFWTKKRSKLEPIQNSKFAPKLMVWGTMSASGVSEQHVLPPNQTERSK